MNVEEGVLVLVLVQPFENEDPQGESLQHMGPQDDALLLEGVWNS